MVYYIELQLQLNSMFMIITCLGCNNVRLSFIHYNVLDTTRCRLKFELNISLRVLFLVRNLMLHLMYYLHLVVFYFVLFSNFSVGHHHRPYSFFASPFAYPALKNHFRGEQQP